MRQPWCQPTLEPPLACVPACLLAFAVLSPVGSACARRRACASCSLAAGASPWCFPAAQLLPTPLPCPRTRRALTRVQCGGHQQLRRALELVAEMRSRGIEANIHTYSALMSVCVKCK